MLFSKEFWLQRVDRHSWCEEQRSCWPSYHLEFSEGTGGKGPGHVVFDNDRTVTVDRDGTAGFSRGPGELVVPLGASYLRMAANGTRVFTGANASSRLSAMSQGAPPEIQRE